MLENIEIKPAELRRALSDLGNFQTPAAAHTVAEHHQNIGEKGIRFSTVILHADRFFSSAVEIKNIVFAEIVIYFVEPHENGIEFENIFYFFALFFARLKNDGLRHSVFAINGLGNELDCISVVIRAVNLRRNGKPLASAVARDVDRKRIIVFLQLCTAIENRSPRLR